MHLKLIRLDGYLELNRLMRKTERCGKQNDNTNHNDANLYMPRFSHGKAYRNAYLAALPVHGVIEFNKKRARKLCIHMLWKTVQVGGRRLRQCQQKFLWGVLCAPAGIIPGGFIGDLIRLSIGDLNRYWFISDDLE